MGARRIILRAGAVVFALCILLVITFTGAFMHLGAWALPFALTVATAKGALVILIFMEQLEAGRAARFAAVAGILWLLLMIGLTFSDEATREHTLPQWGAAES